MKQYLTPFVPYILLGFLLSLFIDNSYTVYGIRTILVFGIVIYFFKDYKLKFRLNTLALLTGLIVAVIWFFSSGLYPLYDIEYNPSTTFLLIVKLIGFLFLAPVVEELFIRDFLLRYSIRSQWQKVPMGTFTWPSFAITVLVFGFAHSQWIAGIITGILFNLLLYKTKRIEDCIVAHFVANLALAIYILTTQSWFLW